MIDQLKTRLVDRVADLTAARVSGAAQFNEMISRGTLPQADFFAFVIPSGLQGRDPTSMSGVFVQPVREAVQIVLGFRTNSASADAALGEIDARIKDVVKAIAGWRPNDTVGVFQLVSGRVASFEKGAVFYQIEFAINDQLRITS